VSGTAEGSRLPGRREEGKRVAGLGERAESDCCWRFLENPFPMK